MLDSELKYQASSIKHHDMESLLSAITKHALPGLRVVDSQPLGAESLVLALSDGRRVVLRVGDVGAEAAALRLLEGEIDLPVPELIDADPEGQVGGEPWLLRSYLEGTPLPQMLAQVGEEERYRIGQRLGEMMTRVHNLSCGRYGLLTGDDPYGATRDDLAYLALRAEAAIVACEQHGLLPEPLAADLRRWFSQEYIATGRPPALIHGDLHPEYVLLRQSGRRDDGGVRLSISGLIGWHNALAWSPGWDHTCLLDGATDPAYFSIRVGYGERYDESNPRAAEQVREYALQPYRFIRYLLLLAEAEDEDERGLYQRHLAALLRLRGRH